MNNTVRGVGWADNLGGVIESGEIKGEMSSPQRAKAPKRELQGPRPAPLKIWRDSHKIRKPPVIIYLQSPEVIQTEAREFMTLVQRLTGRVSAHGDSSMPASSSSIQSQTCHALPCPHTSVPVNPICGQFDDFSPRGGSGLDFDFLVKKDNSSVRDSNPIQSQHATVQSLLSPTQSSLLSPFSPNATVQSLLSPTQSSLLSPFSPNPTVESLLSPTQSSLLSPFSPNLFFPSPRLLSPHIFDHIFEEVPMNTTQPEYFYLP